MSQRFEEGEEGDRQMRCRQHNPEKTKHRCLPENRGSNGESQVVQGSEGQVGGEPSLLSVRSTAHVVSRQGMALEVVPMTISTMTFASFVVWYW